MSAQPDANPALAGAAGSARCRWIISLLGDPFCECGARATQHDHSTGDTLCDAHAEDYAEVFGLESLRAIDGSESPNARRERPSEDGK